MNAVVVDTDVDTDVVSFLFKGHPSASLYKDDLTGRALIISFMTLAELERWPIQAHWGEAKRNHLTEYLRQFAVLPWDRALCTGWAEVMTSAQGGASF